MRKPKVEALKKRLPSVKSKKINFVDFIFKTNISSTFYRLYEEEDVYESNLHSILFCSVIIVYFNGQNKRVCSLKKKIIGISRKEPYNILQIFQLVGLS